MKLLLNSIKLSFSIIIFTAFTFNASAQKWVESMQDPNANFYETQRLFNEYFQGKTYEKGKGWKQFKRWEDFMQTRIDSNGQFTHGKDTYKIYKETQNFYATARLSQGTAGNWAPLGPFGPAQDGGAGRINCIAFHPTDANKILVGAASGGIWESSNNGVSWKTYTDDLATLGISSICYSQSDPNTVYAATGDGDGQDTYTIGVIKSTDGGKHWSSTGLSSPVNYKRLTYKVLVHPTNKNIVYATTNLGIYKTTNGGTSWAKIRVGKFKDMEFKPGDPNTIYFAATNTILKTTNSGTSFTTLTSFQPITQLGRIELGVTPADANYLYVLGGKSSNNGFGGIYLSTNSGTTFTTKASTPNLLGWDVNGTDNGGQAWYDLAIAVSPTNKNTILTGGVNIWKSSNGGTTWSISAHWYGASGTPYVHADIHGLAYSSHNSNTLWACSDGGAFKSTNNGTSWMGRNNQLSIGQMYRMGSSKTKSNKIITGWQDNGSSILTNSWQKVLGGDGMECIIDHSNNNIVYGSVYNGQIRRSSNGGSSWTTISNTIPEQGAWVTPYVMDENNSSILYAGYRNVFKTINKGSSWTKISNFSTNSTINALAVAPSNNQVIYIANSNNVLRTTNGGTSWTNINITGNGSVTYFAIHPTNPNKVWATLSGFYNGQKVMKSTDGGQNWTNISDTLPNIPINCIVYENNSADGIYIGTDVGVYYRDDNLNRWVPYMKNLPNVIVKELEIYYPDHKIRAATYGRSMWESVLYAYATKIDKSRKLDAKLKLYPNPAQHEINIDMDGIKYNNASLRIMNNIGAVVKKLNNDGRSLIKVSISDLQSGVYFIELQTETSVFYGKFIKQ